MTNEAVTVRLSDEERALLADLAEDFGSQSGAVRHGIRSLAQQRLRRRALQDLLDDWNNEAGPLEPSEVEAMGRRYFSA